jgi:hypothetical protein
MLFVGLDLHKRYSYVVVMNEGGEAQAECQLANQAVAAHIGELEATFNWQYMFEQLEDKAARR